MKTILLGATSALAMLVGMSSSALAAEGATDQGAPVEAAPLAQEDIQPGATVKAMLLADKPDSAVDATDIEIVRWASDTLGVNTMDAHKRLFGVAQHPQFRAVYVIEAVVNMAAGNRVPSVELTPPPSGYPMVCDVKGGIDGDENINVTNVFLPGGKADKVVVRGQSAHQVLAVEGQTEARTNLKVGVGCQRAEGGVTNTTSKKLDPRLERSNMVGVDNLVTGLGKAEIENAKDPASLLGVGVKVLLSDENGQGAQPIPAGKFGYDKSAFTGLGMAGNVVVSNQVTADLSKLADGYSTGWHVDVFDQRPGKAGGPLFDWEPERDAVPVLAYGNPNGVFSVKDPAKRSKGTINGPRKQRATTLLVTYQQDIVEYALALTANGPRSNGVMCHPKLDIEGVGTVVEGDLVALGRGHAMIFGKASQGEGGTRAAVTLACSRTIDPLVDRSQFWNMYGLKTQANGDFANDEIGVSLKVLRKGTNEAVFRPLAANEMLVETKENPDLAPYKPVAKKPVAVKVAPAAIAAPAPIPAPKAEEPKPEVKAEAPKADYVQAAKADDIAKGLEKGVQIDVAVTFATGKSDLDLAGRKAVTEIANALKSTGMEKVRVRVEGHTDDVGGDAANMELSRKRAQAVVDELTVVHGLAADRLEAAGYGKTRPRVPNTSDANRAQNRRTTIVKL